MFIEGNKEASSAIPDLGPEDARRGWAHWVYSHYLAQVLGTLRVWLDYVYNHSEPQNGEGHNQHQFPCLCVIEKG